VTGEVHYIGVKLWKTSVRITGLFVEIWNWDLLKSKQDCYPLNCLLSCLSNPNILVSALTENVSKSPLLSEQWIAFHGHIRHRLKRTSRQFTITGTRTHTLSSCDCSKCLVFQSRRYANSSGSLCDCTKNWRRAALNSGVIILYIRQYHSPKNTHKEERIYSSTEWILQFYSLV
jgi:hypothetical protein